MITASSISNWNQLRVKTLLYFVSCTTLSRKLGQVVKYFRIQLIHVHVKQPLDTPENWGFLFLTKSPLAVVNLVEGIDVPAIEARIAQYEKENAEQIMNAQARKVCPKMAVYFTIVLVRCSL